MADLLLGKATANCFIASEVDAWPIIGVLGFLKSAV
ncbi:hypothetical protein DSM3645_05610 [Blastopirellula marina DSM 3645]|uniref:Uncharacterized protein n=1 Tax=Blastopirellula marina DSM 3645 TaxID=314230 RepID=A3ZU11_9BACT|nr:hypothetical protein DSM3645_05610 [Blastopirellula marina DSM 3645]